MKLALSLLIINLAFLPRMIAQTAPYVARVEPKYQDIQKIITDAYNEIKGAFNEDPIFVINVDRTDNQYEIKAGPVSKKDFGWLLRKTKATPYGYFKIDNITVIIFGNRPETVFKKTNETTIYDWLTPLPPFKDMEVIITPNFEPPVWLYEFNNKEFKFIGVSQNELISINKKQ